MPDARQELYRTIKPVWNAGVGLDAAIDAILKRFEVTPKPVVTDDQLGRLVCFAHMGSMPGSGGANYVRGGRMREVLEQHGLKIVRVDDHD